ncbi:O-antigen ligase family protein [Flavobacterium sp. HNIBRBA15423]|uniref:O-antigen ligase family protein n=1 Tax=Flavobacterium sp. HNIBRBA15423 TaxID=3458683 RepID=UPI0040449FA2
MTYIITNAIYVILMIIYILHLGYLSSSNDLYYYYSYITYEFYFLSDHPIYLSTQFALAVFFLIYSKFIKVLKIVLFVILITGIFFLSRKGVIFSFVIVISFYLFQTLKSKKIFLIVFGFIFLGFISSMFVPEIRMRYEEIFDKKKIIYNEETSTGIRTILWKNSLELIQKKPLLGYGIGDSHDVLCKRIEEKGFLKIAKKKSNCHNQYLQFLLSIGIVGLFFFFSTIFYCFLQFKKRGDLRAITILIFFLLLFTTESFLDRQNGIIIFTTFMSILIFIDNKKKDLV